MENDFEPDGGSVDSINALKEERDDFKKKWLLAEADLENYKRRTREEIKQQKLFAVAPIVKDLLPVLDNLYRALGFAENDALKMIIKQFDYVLDKYGVVAIDTTDKLLDPNFHNAISQVESDKPTMTVITECEKGYMMNGRVIRPSSVVVAK